MTKGDLGFAKVVGITIFVALTLWAGAMMWRAVIEIAADPDDWLRPTSWFVSSWICWAYWYWRVIR